MRHMRVMPIALSIATALAALPSARADKQSPPPAAAPIKDQCLMPVSDHWQLYETPSVAPISIGNGIRSIARGARCGLQTSDCAASATAAAGLSQ